MPSIRLRAMPRVVPADRTTAVEIRLPPDLAGPAGDGLLRADHHPLEQDGRDHCDVPVPFDGATGTARVALLFEGEQEHVVVLRRRESDEPAAAARIYSVREDLSARRPFKGDLHIHSCRSDGRDSPEQVPAWCRRIGLDFMAVTDHGLYEPSLEAQAAFAGLPVDVAILPGEEVHAPGNPVHIVNFAGGSSVCALYDDEERYRSEVSRIAQRLPALPPAVDSSQYASCLWCYERVRGAGGLGVFCHPYWFHENHYTPAGALTSYLLAERPFDAFELIGGFYRSEVDSNTLGCPLSRGMQGTWSHADCRLQRCTRL